MDCRLVAFELCGLLLVARQASPDTVRYATADVADTLSEVEHAVKLSPERTLRLLLLDCHYTSFATRLSGACSKLENINSCSTQTAGLFRNAFGKQHTRAEECNCHSMEKKFAKLEVS